MSIARAQLDLVRLRDEIGQLETKISDARERIIKIEHYMEVASEYEADATGGGESRPRAPQGGMSGAAVRTTIDILRERGRAIHTRDLLPMLTEKGIKIGGNQIINLSGYLSRANELVADRSLGWGLLEWQQPSPEKADRTTPDAQQPEPSAPVATLSDGDDDDEL